MHIFVKNLMGERVYSLILLATFLVQTVFFEVYCKVFYYGTVNVRNVAGQWESRNMAVQGNRGTYVWLERLPGRSGGGGESNGG